MLSRVLVFPRSADVRQRESCTARAGRRRCAGSASCTLLMSNYHSVHPCLLDFKRLLKNSEISGDFYRAPGEPDMTSQLPFPLAAYYAAKNKHEVAAMLAPFADDAVVKDEGSEYHGTSAIRSWIEETT